MFVESLSPYSSQDTFLNAPSLADHRSLPSAPRCRCAAGIGGSSAPSPWDSLLAFARSGGGVGCGNPGLDRDDNATAAIPAPIAAAIGIGAIASSRFAVGAALAFSQAVAAIASAPSAPTCRRS